MLPREWLGWPSVTEHSSAQKLDSDVTSLWVLFSSDMTFGGEIPGHLEQDGPTAWRQWIAPLNPVYCVECLLLIHDKAGAPLPQPAALQE